MYRPLPRRRKAFTDKLVKSGVSYVSVVYIAVKNIRT